MENNNRLGKTKYPRTWHLPWSESISSDDNWLADCRHFEGREVVITEKLDGENTTMYHDYIHARSIDSLSHPCRTRVRSTWGAIRHEIPDGWRITGENLEAAHSIWYLDLDEQVGKHSLFYCFGIYDNGICLSWDETLSYCEMLGLFPPPEFYRGPWNEKRIRKLWDDRNHRSAFTTVHTPQNHQVPPLPWEKFGSSLLPMSPTTGEGYVVRAVDSFPEDEFPISVAKFVRKNHVQTDGFWMSKPVLPNWTTSTLKAFRDGASE